MQTQNPSLPCKAQAVNLFLLGDADLRGPPGNLPPPAWLGQGRKGFQLKDKTLLNQAMQ